jgi:hypothetical protein
MILYDFPYGNEATGEKWMTTHDMDLLCFAEAAAMSAMPFFNTFKPDAEGKNDLHHVANRIREMATSALHELFRDPRRCGYTESTGYITVEVSRPHPDDGGRIELNAYLDLGTAKWWDMADMVEPAAKAA